MTLTHYLRILRKSWLTVLNCAILGVLAAGVITLLMPKVYTAQTTSFVSITAASSRPDALYQNSQFALNSVGSYTTMVASPAVLKPVIDQLHLKMSPSALAEQVTATNPQNTVLITISARDNSPAQAKAIADAVATQLGNQIETLEKPKNGTPSPVSVSTAVPAGIPTSPTSPKPSLNLALGLILGFVLGACAAVLRDHFDTTVKSATDLQSLSGGAPLGTIPFAPTASSRPLLVLGDDAHQLESFRTVRTNLQFVDVDHPPRRVVITSAVSGEGKSVTAVNLAITLATGGTRVCLVEADLRLPKVSSYLGLNGAIGLTNVVAGQYVLDDALIPWNRGQLVVLPAGTTPPDPSQLLGSHAVEGILERLSQQFDVVILDAPPVLPVTDAAVLARLSDGAVLVVRQGKTRREDVVSAIEHLAKAQAHVIGTVLCGVPAKRGHDPYDGYASKPGSKSSGHVEASLADAEHRALSRRAGAHESEVEGRHAPRDAGATTHSGLK